MFLQPQTYLSSCMADTPTRVSMVTLNTLSPKLNLPYFQLHRQFYNIIHPVSQDIVLKFIIDASFPHSNPITHSPGDGEVQSYLIWKEKRIGFLRTVFLIFVITVDNIFIVFVYQMVNMIRIILIILHVLSNLIFITK